MRLRVDGVSCPWDCSLVVMCLRGVQSVKSHFSTVQSHPGEGVYTCIALPSQKDFAAKHPYLPSGHDLGLPPMAPHVCTSHLVPALVSTARMPLTA